MFLIAVMLSYQINHNYKKAMFPLGRFLRSWVKLSVRLDFRITSGRAVTFLL